MANAEIGEFQIPYPKCCFEFIISDHRVCALMGTDGKTDSSYLAIFYQAGPVWVSIGPFIADGTNWRRAVAQNDSEIALPLADFVYAHIRAVCVSLEAEAAVADTVRVPHKINSKCRAAGRHEPYDYRELRFSRKPRPSSLLDHADGTPKRLHFRRGHWRHFGNHKTWVNWCLVGDPDLGFIDKHYSL